VTKIFPEIRTHVHSARLIKSKRSFVTGQLQLRTAVMLLYLADERKPTPLIIQKK
jgi:hypothetical protein